MLEFAIVERTEKPFSEAVVALRRAVEANKWGILGSHDFGEILAGKGLPQREQYKTLEICAPAHADAMLAWNPLVALCMPCSVLVYTENGSTYIAALRPGKIVPTLFGGGDVPTASADVIDGELRTIVDAAK
ncbi:MAG: DUF302 domain-containing protein [Armatimonadetes bacterium]|nr:DUF302 domain-containing protein [Armatimonadota bacterium]